MDERLNEILAVSLAHEDLTEEERRILEQWLKENVGNRRRYELLIKLYKSGENFRHLQGIDREKAWQEIFEKTAGQWRKKKRIWLGQFAGIAAGLALLISIAIHFFYKEIADTVHYTGLVMPGSGQVQLKLGNGENIDLSELSCSMVMSDDQVVAKCDSNGLNYQLNSVQVGVTSTEENTLVVPVAGEFCLLLGDGTRVYVNAASELRYPTKFTGDKREVYLKGEAYFEVARDSTREFIVHTQNMDVQVLGTSFDVNAYPGLKTVSATLTSGKIRAICRGERYDIRPGEQIRNNWSTGEVMVEEVNTELYTCWKDGYYYFEACRLEDIMETLSRWYGITPFFQNSVLKELEFTGRLRRYEDVGQLFRKFEQTRNVCFSRKENTVVVSAK